MIANTVVRKVRNVNNTRLVRASVVSLNTIVVSSKVITKTSTSIVSGYVSAMNWLLKTGNWDDNGVWMDSSNWID